MEEPLYFIGIAGAGMSALAFFLAAQKRQVSGSDTAASKTLRSLQELGVGVETVQDGRGLPRKGTVIYSSAIPLDHPELVLARERKLVIWHRSELLGELTRRQQSLCVTGSHGKSTVSGMLGWIFKSAGANPSILAGAVLKNLGANFCVGDGPLICEADESDNSHLNLQPHFALVTNVDDDHLSKGRTLEDLHASLAAFCEKVPPGGRSFWGASKERGFFPPRRTLRYGRGGDYSLSHLALTPEETCFELYKEGKRLGALTLPLLGEHNAINAVGAAAAALEWGLSFGEVRRALKEFQGIARRQEYKGKRGSLLLYDDYAHHPTEIERTLEAFTLFQRPLVVLFQPHRYSRTRQLLKRFAAAFASVEHLVLLPIYSAGEPQDLSLGELLAQELRSQLKGRLSVVASREEAVAEALRVAPPGALVITMGAGDVFLCSEWLIS